ncbi:RHS repeat-associated core domain-containing protein [Flavobacterium sp. F-65]|uniref:RHS repeat-associated core domain-containing protein n=1 Tax=Flavobacterium pisciphilum TaxID=2893755 RepID=A0ABS8MWY9_9FLAO|nr:DUF6443 domain-containing protein [Flavobacterium sp. F-65]MCC9073233.1 RHS repeat-associated core domain-containing protein [Flavobacterium sp. F-65]
MKKITALLLVLFPIIMIGQTQSENYIKSVTYKVATQTAIAAPTINQANQNITYFDGLGRPIQQISYQASATGKDIVIPTEYDGFGRQLKEYLPFASGQNNSNYIAPSTLIPDLVQQYKTKYGAVNANPYSEKQVEASPLNRVLQQAAPGNDWALANNHTVKMDYQANSDTDQVLLFIANTTWKESLGLYDISLSKANGTGFYPANELYKTITYDENTTASLVEANGSTVEFKNKEGQVVLKRTYDAGAKHDTYYVYDQYGNLTYVIPPKASDLINVSNSPYDTSSKATVASGTTLDLTATNSITLLPGFNAVKGSTFSARIESGSLAILNDLCYQYKYDYRNRLVEKKLPGKQWEFIVYDKLDRPVATGPSNSPFTDLSTTGWLITKYDAFSRPVYTGWMTETAATDTGRKALQDAQNNATVLFETKQATGTIDGIAAYYSNIVAPTSFKLLTVNYYDDYTFPSTPAITIPTSVEGQNTLAASQLKTVSTASWIRVATLSTATLGETTAVFYDAKARPIRNYTQNYLGGYAYTDSNLNPFSGQLQYTITRHKRVSGDPELKTKEAYTYSAQDRLLTHTHQINDGAIELIAANTYDELGQLEIKKVGNTTTAPTQKIDFTYNIRGWLTGINNMSSLTQAGDPKDLFAFKLDYNTVPTGVPGVLPLYNGNISETSWKSNSDSGTTTRGYGYKYDNLNRLKTAVFQKNNAVTNTYNESLSYDKNGNIMGLSRNGSSDTTPTLIDDLVYSYGNANKTNQLMKVADSSNKAVGFVDGSNTGDDYSYDANGNMISDANKNITAITYNHLNLPILITFGSTGNIAYTYNATGQKVLKIVTSGTNKTSTDYVNGYQYENNILQFFPQSEGYVNNNSGTFEYIYQYKDHLGNVRLSYDKNLSIVDENNYYPFGLKQMGYNDVISSLGNAVAKKYKYNNKELQDELGLNFYDYGARNYDPALGRWMNIDPLAEQLYSNTPYNYVSNNPLNFIDPDGRSGIGTLDEKNKTVTISSTMYFYGGGASKQQATDTATNIQKLWNAAGGTMDIDGVTYSVQFAISGEYVSEQDATDMAKNNGSDAENNFVRVEDGSQLSFKSSFYDTPGNSGYFIGSELNNGSTDGHEFGHGLGWYEAGEADGGRHDATVDSGVPGIMSPRGTPVSDQYGYGGQPAGQKTMSPYRRGVLASDITKLNIDTKTLKSSGTVNVGTATNNIYNANGTVKTP